MKRAVIVHCWGGNPEYCWYPQTKKELAASGFEVQVPAMPDADKPNLGTWLPALRKAAGEPNQDLFLVGHSAGAVAILRYIESLSENEKIGGVVLVAPFMDDLGRPELTNFFSNPLDFSKLRARISKLLVIGSDDDPYVPLMHCIIINEKIGGELVIKHKMQHFSGPLDREDSCTLLPDVAEWIAKISAK